jgi:ABC-type lipoprotein export system ATPase subunit
MGEETVHALKEFRSVFKKVHMGTSGSGKSTLLIVLVV